MGGKELDPDQYPWFLTDCQTEDTGKCRKVPYSIKSFSVSEAGGDDCMSWAFQGDSKKDDASRLGKEVARLVLGLASIATLFLLL